ncbi:gamma-glutamylcyclotransferase [Palleronia sediminis]|uniref:glutathione-specific gamma-glutamylcyclotransferase n=1 Tax=Palleronia sediminis TaxID=2547833 RepID=A0A4R6ADD2_9RHOB|nr:gamma-glutamylcyclotransferase [Palleronia sediminis]TDL81850.1 gamma-glutamylcyclotransferase [Palleronia sediminis]
MWVFGYASLIWNPEFPVAERVVARLQGYARTFSMRSIHHRGTAEAPGLVLALDETPGAECFGQALRVEEGHEVATLGALRERELVSSAYLERHLAVGLADGRRVEAIGYVVDKAHTQYCGGLPVEEQARIIAAAVGGRGPNDEYLLNTASHLAEIGISDPELDRLAALVDTMRRNRG